MARLLDLPLELLEEIVVDLCVHCNPIERRCCYSSSCNCAEVDPADLARISSLASLCLTSRWFNHVATQHLYHHVHGQRWWLLARTLLTRTDFARIIKSMHIGAAQRVDEDDCPPQVVFYYRKSHNKILDALPEPARHEAMPRFRDVRLYVDTENGNNVHIDILCSLCPNLQALEAVVGYSYFENFRFCGPRSMPHLRSIVLSHGDTELGVDLEEVAALFRAAPNITHAVFHMVSACSKLDNVTLPKLTSLDFQSSTFDGPSLVKILSACLNLEKFRYEMGGAIVGHGQFEIQEARDAFLTHAPNLKSLSLEAGDNDNWDEDWDAAEADEMGKLLEERGVRFELKPYVW